MSRNKLVGCSCGRLFGDYRTQEKHSVKEGPEQHKRVYLGNSKRVKKIVDEAPDILNEAAYLYFME